MKQPLWAIGTDLVCIPEFASQLDVPGTRFADVFTAGELRVAATRQPAQRAAHLAGRWAAKEAFIKAWSQALYGRPPALADVPPGIFRSLDVRPDAWGRVAVVPDAELDAAIRASLREVLAPPATTGQGSADVSYTTSLSISHDGDYATASVMLSAVPCAVPGTTR